MVWRIGAPKGSWHPNHCDVFYFVCALLAILKPALKKRLCPQNSKQKSLEKCHPIRSHRELHVRSCHSGKDVCCGFNTLMLQGKSCSLEEVRGGILALKSVACQKTECQRGLEQTFCDYEHIAKKRGVHWKGKGSQSKTVWRRPGGNLPH